MTTPATRTPVRIARGTYADLNASILDLLEGEICYATDQNKVYVIEGGSLVGTALTSADVGVTVQGYDADTVKQDVLPTFTVATRTTERVITGGAPDFATANLWACAAITVSNPINAAAGQTGAFRITAGPVVWSSNYKFPGGTAPTIASFPAIIPYYVQDSTTILMGNVVEGIA